MQTPMVKSGIQPKISVWLDDSENQEHSIKRFHCTVCGHVVFEYRTSQKMMVPGEHGESASPIIIQCNGIVTTFKDGRKLNTRCKTKYSVQ